MYLSCPLYYGNFGQKHCPTHNRYIQIAVFFKIPEHENIKAFVSHAGILSTIEAVDAGIPVIAVPLFGDQYGNAAVLQDAGMATIVDYQDLKKEFLLDAINEVLDPK